MAHNYIIQWNCRRLRSNREDIELLIWKYSPAAICLQETLLTPYQTQTFKHYSAYYKSGIHGHGGVCIVVKDKFIHSQVQFQADLQAVAVCITINDKTYTVASVYVPPSDTLNELAFDRMINSFSSRYFILGDFNYSAYYKSGIHGHGGVCILVKNKFIHSQVQFQADLQAIAVCITINNKTYTVASVYVPPSEAINELAFDRMIQQFFISLLNIRRF